ncbi:MAG: hypothetical protein WC530_00700 [Candidatus Omnitrophota bacterium]
MPVVPTNREVMPVVKTNVPPAIVETNVVPAKVIIPTNAISTNVPVSTNAFMVGPQLAETYADFVNFGVSGPVATQKVLLASNNRQQADAMTRQILRRTTIPKPYTPRFEPYQPVTPKTPVYQAPFEPVKVPVMPVVPTNREVMPVVKTNVPPAIVETNVVPAKVIIPTNAPMKPAVPAITPEVPLLKEKPFIPVSTNAFMAGPQLAETYADFVSFGVSGPVSTQKVLLASNNRQQADALTRLVITRASEASITTVEVSDQAKMREEIGFFIDEQLPEIEDPVIRQQAAERAEELEAKVLSGEIKTLREYRLAINQIVNEVADLQKAVTQPEAGTEKADNVASLERYVKTELTNIPDAAVREKAIKLAKDLEIRIWTDEVRSVEEFYRALEALKATVEVLSAEQVQALTTLDQRLAGLKISGFRRLLEERSKLDPASPEFMAKNEAINGYREVILRAIRGKDSAFPESKRTIFFNRDRPWNSAWSNRAALEDRIASGDVRVGPKFRVEIEDLAEKAGISLKGKPAAEEAKGPAPAKASVEPAKPAEVKKAGAEKLSVEAKKIEPAKLAEGKSVTVKEMPVVLENTAAATVVGAAAQTLTKVVEQPVMPKGEPAVSGGLGLGSAAVRQMTEAEAKENAEIAKKLEGAALRVLGTDTAKIADLKVEYRENEAGNKVHFLEAKLNVEWNLLPQFRPMGEGATTTESWVLQPQRTSPFTGSSSGSNGSGDSYGPIINLGPGIDVMPILPSSPSASSGLSNEQQEFLSIEKIVWDSMNRVGYLNERVSGSEDTGYSSGYLAQHLVVGRNGEPSVLEFKDAATGTTRAILLDDFLKGVKVGTDTMAGDKETPLEKLIGFPPGTTSDEFLKTRDDHPFANDYISGVVSSLLLRGKSPEYVAKVFASMNKDETLTLAKKAYERKYGPGTFKLSDNDTEAGGLLTYLAETDAKGVKIHEVFYERGAKLFDKDGWKPSGVYGDVTIKVDTQELFDQDTAEKQVLVAQTEREVKKAESAEAYWRDLLQIGYLNSQLSNWRNFGNMTVRPMEDQLKAMRKFIADDSMADVQVGNLATDERVQRMNLGKSRDDVVRDLKHTLGVGPYDPLDGSFVLGATDLKTPEILKALGSRHSAKANALVLAKLQALDKDFTSKKLDEVRGSVLAQALNRVIETTDLDKKVNADQYKKALPEEVRQLLVRAQGTENPLSRQERSRLNGALLQAIYPGMIEKTPLDIPIEKITPAVVMDRIQALKLSGKVPEARLAARYAAAQASLANLQTMKDTDVTLYVPEAIWDILKTSGTYTIGDDVSLFFGLGVSGSLDWIFQDYLHLGKDVDAKEREAVFRQDMWKLAQAAAEAIHEQEAAKERLKVIKMVLEGDKTRGLKGLEDRARGMEQLIETYKKGSLDIYQLSDSDMMYTAKELAQLRDLIAGLQQEYDLLMLLVSFDDKGKPTDRINNKIKEIMEQAEKQFPESKEYRHLFKSLISWVKKTVQTDKGARKAIIDSVLTSARLRPEADLAEMPAMDPAARVADGKQFAELVRTLGRGRVLKAINQRMQWLKEADDATAEVKKFGYTPGLPRITYNTRFGYLYNLGNSQDILQGNVWYGSLCGLLSVGVTVADFGIADEVRASVFAGQSAAAFSAGAAVGRISVGFKLMEDLVQADALETTKEAQFSVRQLSYAKSQAISEVQSAAQGPGTVDTLIERESQKALDGVFKASNDVLFSEKTLMKSTQDLRMLLNARGDETIAKVLGLDTVAVRANPSEITKALMDVPADQLEGMRERMREALARSQPGNPVSMEFFVEPPAGKVVPYAEKIRHATLTATAELIQWAKARNLGMIEQGHVSTPQEYPTDFAPFTVMNMDGTIKEKPALEQLSVLTSSLHDLLIARAQKIDGSYQLESDDIVAPLLRDSLKENQPGTNAAARDIVLTVLKDVGVDTIQLDTVPEKTLVKALNRALNRILDMSDLPGKVNAEAYKKDLPEEVQKLLERAQKPKSDLTRQERARLNRALIHAIYPQGVTMSPVETAKSQLLEAAGAFMNSMEESKSLIEPGATVKMPIAVLKDSLDQALDGEGFYLRSDYYTARKETDLEDQFITLHNLIEKISNVPTHEEILDQYAQAWQQRMQINAIFDRHFNAGANLGWNPVTGGLGIVPVWNQVPYKVGQVLDIADDIPYAGILFKGVAVLTQTDLSDEKAAIQRYRTESLKATHEAIYQKGRDKSRVSGLLSDYSWLVLEADGLRSLKTNLAEYHELAQNQAINRAARDREALGSLFSGAGTDAQNFDYKAREISEKQTINDQNRRWVEAQLVQAGFSLADISTIAKAQRAVVSPKMTPEAAARETVWAKKLRLETEYRAIASNLHQRVFNSDTFQSWGALPRIDDVRTRMPGEPLNNWAVIEINGKDKSGRLYKLTIDPMELMLGNRDRALKLWKESMDKEMQAEIIEKGEALVELALRVITEEELRDKLAPEQGLEAAYNLEIARTLHREGNVTKDKAANAWDKFFRTRIGQTENTLAANDAKAKIADLLGPVISIEVGTYNRTESTEVAWKQPQAALDDLTEVTAGKDVRIGSYLDAMNAWKEDSMSALHRLVTPWSEIGLDGKSAKVGVTLFFVGSGAAGDRESANIQSEISRKMAEHERLDISNRLANAREDVNHTGDVLREYANDLSTNLTKNFPKFMQNLATQRQGIDKAGLSFSDLVQNRETQTWIALNLHVIARVKFMDQITRYGGNPKDFGMEGGRDYKSQLAEVLQLADHAKKEFLEKDLTTQPVASIAAPPENLRSTEPLGNIFYQHTLIGMDKLDHPEFQATAEKIFNVFEGSSGVSKEVQTRLVTLYANLLGEYAKFYNLSAVLDGQMEGQWGVPLAELLTIGKTEGVFEALQPDNYFKTPWIPMMLDPAARELLDASHFDLGKVGFASDFARMMNMIVNNPQTREIYGLKTDLEAQNFIKKVYRALPNAQKVLTRIERAPLPPTDGVQVLPYRADTSREFGRMLTLAMHAVADPEIGDPINLMPAEKSKAQLGVVNDIAVAFEGDNIMSQIDFRLKLIQEVLEKQEMWKRDHLGAVNDIAAAFEGNNIMSQIEFRHIRKDVLYDGFWPMKDDKGNLQYTGVLAAFIELYGRKADPSSLQDHASLLSLGETKFRLFTGKAKTPEAKKQAEFDFITFVRGISRIEQNKENVYPKLSDSDLIKRAGAYEYWARRTLLYRDATAPAAERLSEIGKKTLEYSRAAGMRDAREGLLLGEGMADAEALLTGNFIENPKERDKWNALFYPEKVEILVQTDQVAAQLLDAMENVLGTSLDSHDPKGIDTGALRGHALRIVYPELREGLSPQEKARQNLLPLDERIAQAERQLQDMAELKPVVIKYHQDVEGKNYSQVPRKQFGQLIGLLDTHVNAAYRLYDANREPGMKNKASDPAAVMDFMKKEFELRTDVYNAAKDPTGLAKKFSESELASFAQTIRDLREVEGCSGLTPAQFLKWVHQAQQATEKQGSSLGEVFGAYSAKSSRPFWMSSKEAGKLQRIVMGDAGLKGLKDGGLTFDESASFVEDQIKRHNLATKDPDAANRWIDRQIFVQMYLQSVYKLYHRHSDGSVAEMNPGELSSKTRLILAVPDDKEFSKKLSDYAFEIKLEGLAALMVSGQMASLDEFNGNEYQKLLPALSKVFMDELNWVNRKEGKDKNKKFGPKETNEILVRLFEDKRSGLASLIVRYASLDHPYLAQDDRSAVEMVSDYLKDFAFMQAVNYVIHGGVLPLETINGEIRDARRGEKQVSEIGFGNLSGLWRKNTVIRKHVAEQWNMDYRPMPVKDLRFLRKAYPVYFEEPFSENSFLLKRGQPGVDLIHSDIWWLGQFHQLDQTLEKYREDQVKKGKISKADGVVTADDRIRTRYELMAFVKRLVLAMDSAKFPEGTARDELVRSLVGKFIQQFPSDQDRFELLKSPETIKKSQKIRDNKQSFDKNRKDNQKKYQQRNMDLENDFSLRYELVGDLEAAARSVKPLLDEVTKKLSNDSEHPDLAAFVPKDPLTAFQTDIQYDRLRLIRQVAVTGYDPQDVVLMEALLQPVLKAIYEKESGQILDLYNSEDRIKLEVWARELLSSCELARKDKAFRFSAEELVQGIHRFQERQRLIPHILKGLKDDLKYVGTSADAVTKEATRIAEDAENNHITAEMLDFWFTTTKELLKDGFPSGISQKAKDQKIIEVLNKMDSVLGLRIAPSAYSLAPDEKVITATWEKNFGDWINAPFQKGKTPAVDSPYDLLPKVPGEAIGTKDAADYHYGYFTRSWLGQLSASVSRFATTGETPRMTLERNMESAMAKDPELMDRINAAIKARVLQLSKIEGGLDLVALDELKERFQRVYQNLLNEEYRSLKQPVTDGSPKVTRISPLHVLIMMDQASSDPAKRIGLLEIFGKELKMEPRDYRIMEEYYSAVMEGVLYRQNLKIFDKSKLFSVPDSERTLLDRIFRPDQRGIGFAIWVGFVVGFVRAIFQAILTHLKISKVAQNRIPTFSKFFSKFLKGEDAQGFGRNFRNVSWGNLGLMYTFFGILNGTTGVAIAVLLATLTPWAVAHFGAVALFGIPILSVYLYLYIMPKLIQQLSYVQFANAMGKFKQVALIIGIVLLWVGGISAAVSGWAAVKSIGVAAIALVAANPWLLIFLAPVPLMAFFSWLVRHRSKSAGLLMLKIRPAIQDPRGLKSASFGALMKKADDEVRPGGGRSEIRSEVAAKTKKEDLEWKEAVELLNASHPEASLLEELKKMVKYDEKMGENSKLSPAEKQKFASDFAAILGTEKTDKTEGFKRIMVDVTPQLYNPANFGEIKTVIRQALRALLTNNYDGTLNVPFLNGLNDKDKLEDGKKVLADLMNQFFKQLQVLGVKDKILQPMAERFAPLLTPGSRKPSQVELLSMTQAFGEDGRIIKHGERTFQPMEVIKRGDDYYFTDPATGNIDPTHKLDRSMYYRIKHLTADGKKVYESEGKFYSNERLTNPVEPGKVKHYFPLGLKLNSGVMPVLKQGAEYFLDAEHTQKLDDRYTGDVKSVTGPDGKEQWVLSAMEHLKKRISDGDMEFVGAVLEDVEFYVGPTALKDVTMEEAQSRGKKGVYFDVSMQMADGFYHGMTRMKREVVLAKNKEIFTDDGKEFYRDADKKQKIDDWMLKDNFRQANGKWFLKDEIASYEAKYEDWVDARAALKGLSVGKNMEDLLKNVKKAIMTAREGLQKDEKTRDIWQSWQKKLYYVDEAFKTALTDAEAGTEALAEMGKAISIIEEIMTEINATASQGLIFESEKVLKELKGKVKEIVAQLTEIKGKNLLKSVDNLKRHPLKALLPENLRKKTDGTYELQSTRAKVEDIFLPEIYTVRGMDGVERHFLAHVSVNKTLDGNNIPSPDSILDFAQAHIENSQVGTLQGRLTYESEEPSLMNFSGTVADNGLNSVGQADAPMTGHQREYGKYSQRLTYLVQQIMASKDFPYGAYYSRLFLFAPNLYEQFTNQLKQEIFRKKLEAAFFASDASDAWVDLEKAQSDKTLNEKDFEKKYGFSRVDLAAAIKFQKDHNLTAKKVEEMQNDIGRLNNTEFQAKYDISQDEAAVGLKLTAQFRAKYSLTWVDLEIVRNDPEFEKFLEALGFDAKKRQILKLEQERFTDMKDMKKRVLWNTVLGADLNADYDENLGFQVKFIDGFKKLSDPMQGLIRGIVREKFRTGMSQTAWEKWGANFVNSHDFARFFNGEDEIVSNNNADMQAIIDWGGRNYAEIKPFFVNGRFVATEKNIDELERLTRYAPVSWESIAYMPLDVFNALHERYQKILEAQKTDENLATTDAILWRDYRSSLLVREDGRSLLIDDRDQFDDYGTKGSKAAKWKANDILTEMLLEYGHTFANHAPQRFANEHSRKALLSNFTWSVSLILGALTAFVCGLSGVALVPLAMITTAVILLTVTATALIGIFVFRFHREHYLIHGMFSVWLQNAAEKSPGFVGKLKGHPMITRFLSNASFYVIALFMPLVALAKLFFSWGGQGFDLWQWMAEKTNMSSNIYVSRVFNYGEQFEIIWNGLNKDMGPYVFSELGKFWWVKAPFQLIFDPIQFIIRAPTYWRKIKFSFPIRWDSSAPNMWSKIKSVKIGHRIDPVRDLYFGQFFIPPAFPPAPVLNKDRELKSYMTNTKSYVMLAGYTIFWTLILKAAFFAGVFWGGAALFIGAWGLWWLYKRIDDARIAYSMGESMKTAFKTEKPSTVAGLKFDLKVANPVVPELSYEFELSINKEKYVAIGKNLEERRKLAHNIVDERLASINQARKKANPGIADVELKDEDRTWAEWQVQTKLEKFAADEVETVMHGRKVMRWIMSVGTVIALLVAAGMPASWFIMFGNIAVAMLFSAISAYKAGLATTPKRAHRLLALLGFIGFVAFTFFTFSPLGEQLLSYLMGQFSEGLLYVQQMQGLQMGDTSIGVGMGLPGAPGWTTLILGWLFIAQLTGGVIALFIWRARNWPLFFKIYNKRFNKDEIDKLNNERKKVWDKIEGVKTLLKTAIAAGDEKKQAAFLEDIKNLFDKQKEAGEKLNDLAQDLEPLPQGIAALPSIFEISEENKDENNLELKNKQIKELNNWFNKGVKDSKKLEPVQKQQANTVFVLKNAKLQTENEQIVRAIAGLKTSAEDKQAIVKLDELSQELEMLLSRQVELNGEVVKASAGARAEVRDVNELNRELEGVNKRIAEIRKLLERKSEGIPAAGKLLPRTNSRIEVILKLIDGVRQQAEEIRKVEQVIPATLATPPVAPLPVTPPALEAKYEELLAQKGELLKKSADKFRGRAEVRASIAELEEKLAEVETRMTELKAEVAAAPTNETKKKLLEAMDRLDAIGGRDYRNYITAKKNWLGNQASWIFRGIVIGSLAAVAIGFGFMTFVPAMAAQAGVTVAVLWLVAVLAGIGKLWNISKAKKVLADEMRAYSEKKSSEEKIRETVAVSVKPPEPSDFLKRVQKELDVGRAHDFYPLTDITTAKIPGDRGFLRSENPGRKAREEAIARPLVDLGSIYQEEGKPNDYEAIVTKYPEQKLFVEIIDDVPITVNRNANPLRLDHALFFPKVELHLTQSMTPWVLKLMLATAEELGQNALLGFNGIRAGASIVRQLHFQGFVNASEEFAFDRAVREEVLLTKNGVTVERFKDYPAQALIFSGGNRAARVSATYDFIEILKAVNIPSNVIVRRGNVYVFPRSRVRDELFPGRIGFAELAGLFYVTGVTEERLAGAMRKETVSPELFASVLQAYQTPADERRTTAAEVAKNLATREAEAAAKAIAGVAATPAAARAEMRELYTPEFFKGTTIPWEKYYEEFLKNEDFKSLHLQAVLLVAKTGIPLKGYTTLPEEFAAYTLLKKQALRGTEISSKILASIKKDMIERGENPAEIQKLDKELDNMLRRGRMLTVSKRRAEVRSAREAEIEATLKAAVAEGQRAQFAVTKETEILLPEAFKAEGVLVNGIMKALGVESVEAFGAVTPITIVYDKNDPNMAKAIGILAAVNSKAQITVAVANAIEEAVAQKALVAISGIRIVISTNIRALAQAEAVQLGLKLEGGRPSKHVLQVRKIKGELLSKKVIRAFALAGQMEGVVVILNYDHEVDFATKTDVDEVLRSEILAAEAIQQSV